MRAAAYRNQDIQRLETAFLQAAIAAAEGEDVLKDIWGESCRVNHPCSSWNKIHELAREQAVSSLGLSPTEHRKAFFILEVSNVNHTPA